MELSPAHYGLHSRTQLKQLGTNHLGIVRMVKSRIIRKDANKIIEMAEKILAINPLLQISLVCTSNICSKSVELLKHKQIEIKIEE